MAESLKLALGPASHEADSPGVSSRVAGAEAVLELIETWRNQAAEMEIFLRCSCSPSCK